MKRLNKKGFTLVELLIVIVILGILVAVAVPAFNGILNNARKDTMKNEAHTIIEGIRTAVLSNSYTTTTTFTYTGTSTDGSWDASPAAANVVDDIMFENLKRNPFGKAYTSIKVVYTYSSTESTYSICMTDGTNGINATESSGIDTVTEFNITSCP